MPVQVTPEDLEPFAQIDTDKALAMIADAMALAVQVAPCIEDPDFPESAAAAAKAIIRGAILRWNDAGTGAVQQRQAGPFMETTDTRTMRRGMFWPSEIADLQKLCQDSSAISGAFAIDTDPRAGQCHSQICSLAFGATYCSCGADLTGSGPLWEG